jgi:hypothetical protein
VTVSVLFSTVSFNYPAARHVGKRMMIKMVKADVSMVIEYRQVSFETLLQRGMKQCGGYAG